MLPWRFRIYSRVVVDHVRLSQSARNQFSDRIHYFGTKSLTRKPTISKLITILEPAVSRTVGRGETKIEDTILKSLLARDFHLIE